MKECRAEYERVFAEELAEIERAAEEEKIRSALRKLNARSKKSSENTEPTRRSTRLADINSSETVEDEEDVMITKRTRMEVLHISLLSSQAHNSHSHPPPSCSAIQFPSSACKQIEFFP